MKDNQKNTIKELSFNHALKTIRFSNSLDEQRKYVISKQLLRSGTSIGANVREAQFAESKADFIHKLKIALKEANENCYWLELCEKSEDYPNPGVLRDEVVILIKMLTKSIMTLQSKGLH